MTDLDKDRHAKPATDEELPGDEELDEEPDEFAETEAEQADREAEEADLAPAGERRRFGFGRNRHADEDRHERHAGGSLRESHERVHIDDRPSAIYAIVCAAALLGVILLTWVGGAIPQGTGPTLTPLAVPTAAPTTSPTAAPSVSVSPSVAPSPSPSAT
jgi:hypothetical protein